MPASCQGVIVVAATNSDGRLWRGSNWGGFTVLSAPGQDVWVLTNTGLTKPLAPSTYVQSGTSIAAPHVAAIAAMMLGKNPQLTGRNVEQRLMLSGRPFNKTNIPRYGACVGCGRGIVDAVRAIRSGGGNRSGELEAQRRAGERRLRQRAR